MNAWLTTAEARAMLGHVSADHWKKRYLPRVRHLKKYRHQDNGGTATIYPAGAIIAMREDDAVPGAFEGLAEHLGYTPGFSGPVGE